MTPTAEYDRKNKVWFAYMFDEKCGRCGQLYTGITKETAMYKLGFYVGRKPELFARPTSELFAEIENAR